MGSVLKAHPKAHPDTERAHSDNLYHNDNPPNGAVVEIGGKNTASTIKS